MRNKKNVTRILIFLLCLLGVWQQAAALDLIAKEKEVSVVLTRPQYNENGTICNDLAGYNLYRSTTSGGPYTKLNSVVLPASTTVYVDRYLLNNYSYFYVATSVDDVGNESQYSTEKTAKPFGDEEKPAPITDLHVSTQGGQVHMSWSFSTDNDVIDHYTIYRDLTEIKDIYLSHKRTPGQVQEIVTLNAQTNGYVDIGINAGSTYYYVVTAFDRSGNEADSSNCVSVKVDGVDVTPPLITSVDEDSGGIPKNAGSLVTIIVRGEANCQALVKIGSLSEELAMTETAQPGTYIYAYTVPAGVDQTEIPVSVKIADAAQNVSQKVGDTTLTIDNTSPPAVQGLTVTPMAVPLEKVSWQASSGDVHHYVLYRASLPITLANKGQAAVLARDLALDQFVYLDESALPSQTYYYAVSAVDLAGNESLLCSEPVAVAADIVPPEIVLVTDNTMGATRKQGDEIKITIIGEPGLTASFTIAELLENVVMVEEKVGDIPTGTYYGHYLVLAGDNALNAVVAGKLVDKANLVTTKDGASRINIVTNSADNTPPQITLVSHDAHDVLVAGDVLEVTLEGETGGVAYADLGTIGKAVLLTEASEGMYTGTYNVVRGDNLRDGYVVGHLVDSAGNESSFQADVPVTINTNIKFEMSRGATFLFADGRSSTTVTAKLKNAKGNPLVSELVDFTLVGGDGQLSGFTSGRTNAAGEVSTTYKVGEIVTTAFIAAEAVDFGDVGITYVMTKKSISVDIALLDPNPRFKTTNTEGYEIELFAKPHRITADGHSISVITALVTRNGAPVQNVRVSFDITRGVHGNEGFISVRRAMTDANGEAEAIYTSGTKTQLILVQATAFVPSGAPVSENTQILLIAGGVKYLYIEAEPNQIVADGHSTSIITVKTEDEFNNLVPEIKVEFSLTRGMGTLSDPYNFTSESTYPIQGDAQPAVGGGEASVTFTAGNTTGIETITATVTSETWFGAGNFFRGGLENFSAGDYEGTIANFEIALSAGREDNLGFVTDYTEENWTDDVLFMRGYAYEMTDDYLNAISSFDEVKNYYFGGTWADNAQYRLGQCYEKDDDLAAAIENYQLVINNYTNVAFDLRNLKDNAQFRIGRCYEKSGYVVLARTAYQRLIDFYPTSVLAPEAKAAVKRLSAH